MNLQTMNKQRKFMLITAVIGAIAMFLPWVDVFFISVNGMHGVGILVFLLFIATGIIALMGGQSKSLDKTMWMIALIAATAAALIMIIIFLKGIEAIELYSIGFYLALLSSLALLFVTFQFRESGYNIKDGIDSLKGIKNKDSNSGNSNSI